MKLNVANGGPAPEPVSAAVHRSSLRIREYRIADWDHLDLDRLGEHRLGDALVEVIDPVEDYAGLMESRFDFDRISSLLAGGRFRVRFDAMHAVTGPYAREILERRLGAPLGTVVNGFPLEDFGGLHPDPNLVYARELVTAMNRPDAPDFGAASDGDGDRNVVLGPGLFVSPCDSLAVLAQHARLVPGYVGGLAGVARSMPKSRALDHVAARLGIPCYETPTGWKYFGNLLDAGLVTLCGEERFGAGSDHLRENDGLWTSLFWLNVLAATGQTVGEIVGRHWGAFGRCYYSRHDYDELDADVGQEIMALLTRELPRLVGSSHGPFAFSCCDDFAYTDSTDGSVSEHQGVRLVASDQARIICRLSGTGTGGATLRVYLERFEADLARLELPVHDVLADLAAAAADIAELRTRTSRAGPSVVT